ncbi:MAG: phenylacetate--CoA ligase family protein [Anaerolineales bacterium]|nr:phenylacetate--CoA ligase family protein [Anaerolineales bacterium]MCB0027648.1 phenylacetate--CoA ligase family protein [Anaerolineales bacterium]
MIATSNSIQQRSWTWLLRNILLPLGDIHFGQQLMNRLRFLEQAQWWTPEEIAAHRNQALHTLIETAYQEVPLYRQLYAEAGIKPADIRQAADLQQLPIITKEHLLAGFPEAVTRSTGYKTYVNHTSGSTGKNFRVVEDAVTAGRYRAAFMLALGWSGWEIGVPQLQTGMSLNRTRQKRLKDWLMRCHYTSAYDLTNEHLDETLNILADNDINYLWGYPGSLYYLALRAQEVGWNKPLISAVTWGDNLFPHYRKTIESAFQTRVFDTYGCAEGIQISAQCPEMNYHVHELDTIVEYLDDAGQWVDGEATGRLILTRLHPGPMPLIRYQVGDLGAAGDQSQCACGRHLSRMADIQGRDTDVIITPSGNRLIVHFFTGILEYFTDILEFQAIQEETERIILRIVPSGGFTDEVAQRAINRLKERGAADLQIEIELVDEIPLAATGKRHFIINKLLRNTR